MSWVSSGGYLFIIVLILGLSKLYVIPAPLSPKSFHEAIISKCPSINNPKFSVQGIFTKCKDWGVIGNTSSLTAESVDNVLCLLYYDSIVSFCSELKTKKLIPDIDFVPTLKDNGNVEMICKNLMNARATRKFEHDIIQAIPNDISCVKICSDLSGEPQELCRLSDYFINYAISQITKNSEIPNTEGKLRPPELPGNLANEQNSNPGNEIVVKDKNDVPAPVPPSEVKALSPKNNAIKTKVESVNSHQPREQAPDVDPKNHDNSEKTDQNAVGPNKNAGIENNVLGGSTVIERIPPVGKDEAGQEQQEPQNIPVINVGDNKNENHAATDENGQPQEQPNSPVVNNDETSEKVIHAAGREGVSNPGVSSVVDNAVAADVRDNPLVDNDGNDQNVPPLSNEGDNANVKIEDDPNKGSEGVNMEENFPEDDDDDINIEGDDIKPDKNNEKSIELPSNNNTIEELDGESYFFSYFMVVCVLFILGYVGYHNRQKIIALVLEGKKGKRQYRSRRPNSSNYHKLDSNLEEAISSSCKKNTNNIIY